MAAPLVSFTANFFLTLDVSRPNFKAQALFAADAVATDTTLPAPIQAQATLVRTAAMTFNDKVVASLQPNTAEDFGEVRVAADKVLRAVLKLVGLRYERGSTAYDAFLPQGLTQLNEAQESEYEAYFERFDKAIRAETKPFVNPEAEPGDPTPAQQVATMLARLKAAAKTDAAFETQREKLSTDISADWRTVALAEWGLWLDLCRHFLADPDYRARVYGYFDFSQVGSSSPARPTTPPNP
jgi:hypothetical protein